MLFLEPTQGTKPYPGTNLAAAAYSMQWTNPHPEKPIAEIDVLPGKDAGRGVVALLAVTAATGEPK